MAEDNTESSANESVVAVFDLADDFFTAVDEYKAMLDAYKPLGSESAQGQDIEVPLCPVFEPTNPEGQRYLRLAQAASIDPIVFGMIIRSEWESKAYEHLVPFAPTLSDIDYSYGLGQIQGPTAMEVINNHPDDFGPNGDYWYLYIGGEINQNRVKWYLFTDENFNLLIASYYVADNQSAFDQALETRDIIVSDTPVEGQVAITQEQYNQSMAYMYNAGPSLLVGNLNTVYDNPDEAFDAIVRTLSADQNRQNIENVFGTREYVEGVLGVRWVPCSEIENSDL